MSSMRKWLSSVFALPIAVTTLWLLLAVTLSCLTGCATAPQIEYQRVDVPIYTPCPRGPFARPKLPLAALTDAATDADVVQAYIDTVAELLKEIDEFDSAAAACKAG